MRKIFLAILTSSALLLSTQATATPNNATQQEILHLLNFIANSSCTFVRNGSEYPAIDARAHIERKYEYVKSRIDSSEKFIKYAATESSMSGDPYRVKCADQEILSKDWLLNELKDLRDKKRFIKTGSATPKEQKAVMCTEPRPQKCTRIYKPVCATFNDQSQKSYTSDCTACADSNVVSYVPGKCTNDKSL